MFLYVYDNISYFDFSAAINLCRWCNLLHFSLLNDLSGASVLYVGINGVVSLCRVHVDIKFGVIMSGS